MRRISLKWIACAAALIAGTSLAGKEPESAPHPKVILISLDGAKPDVIERYLRDGVLDKRTGLGRLVKHGVAADRNITVTPSLTAVSHIAIATGSTAVHNDIPANTFHGVVQPVTASLSGFAAPIGGYLIQPAPQPPIPSTSPTAQPLWVRLRESGRRVVAATWPGADGADIRINGSVVQPAVAPVSTSSIRTVDYTVPFGAFGGIGAVGFSLTAANFAVAEPSLVAQIEAAGRHSFSPVRVTTAPIETIYCPSIPPGLCTNTSTAGFIQYRITAAALDTTDDSVENHDMLVFFDANVGITPPPLAPPRTGPAYVLAGGTSGQFYLEGSGNRIGTSFFVSRIDPGLSVVRFARYGLNFIPRNAPVLADVDDVNGNVGFWVAQADFRIPERISPGFGPFTDLELEAMFEDQVATFVDYQTRVGLRAIARNRDADLVMIYIEQPDGSGHQFTLTDSRQATNPADPTSIGDNQDAEKVARYARHLEFAYRAASDAVERIIQSVGVHPGGEPLANVFVVSDHGMAPFHTAVNLTRLLTNAGVDFGSSCGATPSTCRVGIRTSGPAANIYVNLQGRESTGIVTPAQYPALVTQITNALQNATDPNLIYNPTVGPLFTHVWTRPTSCGTPGFCTDDNVGQDTGDVLALMAEGYNFDGVQNVTRLGDVAGSTNPYSVPNFYGAHGHDSEAPSMSAIFYAAGPDVKQGHKVRTMRNIDVAPTILRLLGVAPGPTVDGDSITNLLKDR